MMSVTVSNCDIKWCLKMFDGFSIVNPNVIKAAVVINSQIKQLNQMYLRITTV